MKFSNISSKLIGKKLKNSRFQQSHLVYLPKIGRIKKPGLAIKKFKKIEDFTGEALEDLIVISTNKELLRFDDCWNTKHSFKILIFWYQYQYFEILISILILILLFGGYWSWYWYWHQEKYWYWYWYWYWSWFFGRETIDIDIDIEIFIWKNIDLDIDPKFDIIPPLSASSLCLTAYTFQSSILRQRL